MNDTAGRPGHALRRVATGRETVAAFAALAVLWALGAVGVAPGAVWVPVFPALGGAMLADAFAVNEFGVAEGALFYPALAVWGYLEAIGVGAVVRWLRSLTGGRP